MSYYYREMSFEKEYVCVCAGDLSRVTYFLDMFVWCSVIMCWRVQGQDFDH